MWICGPAGCGRQGRACAGSAERAPDALPAPTVLHVLTVPPVLQPKNLMVSAGARAKEYDKSRYISILNIIQVGLLVAAAGVRGGAGRLGCG